MIRVLVADDHTLVRQALVQMLGMEPDMEVVGEADTADLAVERCRVLAPDVVLMDIHMPDGSEGIEATRAITAQHPEVKVIVLTMERRDQYLFEAIQAGARGYLLKNADTEELVEAIRAAAGGEAAVDTSLSRKMLTEFKRLSSRGPETPFQQLTERERQILSLLARGANNHEIAQQLDISEKTVRNRLSGIFDKLHVNNRTQAALLAKQEGWDRLDD